MARRSYRRKQKQSQSPLLELGFKALVAGAGTLFVSLAMGGNKLFFGVASVLKPAAWLAMGAGAVLLALYGLTQIKAKKTPAATTRGAPPTFKTLLGEVGDKDVPSLRNTDGRTDLDNIGDQSPRTALKKSNPSQAAALRAEGAQWSPAVFAAIEWRRFEAVCETLFAQAGFEAESQSHGADGGVDIWLHSKNAVGPVSVVQCKHWKGKAVGVKELREFFGVMASQGLKRGTYATTSTYTADARDFAQANGISAMDGPALLNLIKTRRTPEQQAALLEVAYEGEYWRPTCPSCGIKLVERMPPKAAPFWGCTNFPRCRKRIYLTATA